MDKCRFAQNIKISRKCPKELLTDEQLSLLYSCALAILAPSVDRIINQKGMSMVTRERLHHLSQYPKTTKEENSNVVNYLIHIISSIARPRPLN